LTAFFGIPECSYKETVAKNGKAGDTNQGAAGMYFYIVKELQISVGSLV
jgi:hypothetical protein